MHVLGVEKLTQMVELGLGAFGGGTVDDIGSVWGHAGDERLGIVCPPGGGCGLDRVHISDQVGAVTQSTPDIFGR